LKLADLHWLAGLLEGEGCFAWQKSTKNRYQYKYPRISLTMTDKDIVARVASLFDVRCLGPYGPYGKLHRGHVRKVVYSTQLYGPRAVSLMRRLYPLMGRRRSSKIKYILERTKQW